MKEIFSAFGSDSLRTLVTLIIPGVIGLNTWLGLLFQKSSGLAALVEKRPIEAAAIFLAATIALGMILQDLGSMLEAAIYDRLLNRKRPTHTDP